MIRRGESFLMLEQNWLLFELGKPLGVLLDWGREMRCIHAWRLGWLGWLAGWAVMNGWTGIKHA
jgi:hypothetical protein